MPLQQGEGETSCPAGGEAIQAPNSAKTPSLHPPGTRRLPLCSHSSPSSPPLPVPSVLTPPSQSSQCQGHTWRMLDAPRRASPGDHGHPGTSGPHAAPRANRHAQKLLCAAAWSRDARGLRSPRGPSQHPPCSPGRAGVCIVGGDDATSRSHAARPPPGPSAE